MPKLIEPVRAGGVGRRAILELIDEMNEQRAARGIRQRYEPTLKHGELSMKYAMLPHGTPSNARSRAYADEVQAIAAQRPTEDA